VHEESGSIVNLVRLEGEEPTSILA